MFRLAAAMSMSTILLAAASAPAPAAQFGTPFPVSSPNSGSPYVHVATGPGGAAFAWRASNGGTQARNRSPNGVLGPIRDLSDLGVITEDPSLAVDADGDAVVIWRRQIGLDRRVQARTLSAASTLSSTQTLSPVGFTAERPQVDVDAKGDAVVTWMRTKGADFRLQARSRSAAGASGPIQMLSAPDFQALLPRIAVDAEGDAVIVWLRSENAQHRVQARTVSAAGVLGPVLTLSPAGAEAFHARVAVDADGDALIVWRGADSGYNRIQARRLSRTGELGPVRMLSPAGRATDNPEVAMDSDGDAVVVWQVQDGFEWRVQTRTRSKTGALGALRTLSAAGKTTQYPHVAVDGDGDAAFVWSYLDGSHYRIQARFRSKAGTLGPIQTLSPAGVVAGGPRIAMDAEGDAVATWYEFTGSYTVMGAATP